MDTTKPDVELKKYMKNIALSNRLDRVIMRGCITGIFTALGATLGFAVVIALLGQFIATFRQIPLLETFLEQTKIDALIEGQVKRLITSPDSQTPTPGGGTTTSEPAQPPFITFSDNQFQFRFDYPSTLTSVASESPDPSSKIIRLSGKSGLLQELDVYINQDVKVTGQGSQRYIPKSGMDRIVVNIYEQGATVDNTQFIAPIYTATVQVEGRKYMFVGVGDSDTPKLARELFLEIIDTAEFK